MITVQSEKKSAAPELVIDGHSLKLEDIEHVAEKQVSVSLSEKGHRQLARSRELIEKLIETGQPIYGVNTGFGWFKDVIISKEDSCRLQHNFIVSHAAGVGPPLDSPAVRAMLLLRANALAKGFSGVRIEIVSLLLACLNRGVHPLIPEQGSLGASGDLAPLAHLALVLMGEGQAEYQGEILPGREALFRAGLKPAIFAAKEGLALLNGTQLMAALGSLIVLEAERLAKIADILGAMSLEALLGSAKAFSDKIHAVRPHPGQMVSAANLRLLLQDSAIIASHAHCGQVQDAYSLRCMPQVHGASRQAFKHIREVLEIEINSATDNPLVFEDSVLFGGNFHGQPLALALDYLSIALSELANIAERRIERLVNPALSQGLPAFLVSDGGLNSGYMIAQYTAAALVSENKCLAHPASVDSIPTSANQEDHVSMGATAARKARLILNNLRKVLAIELLCAVQGLDFRIGNAADLKPGPALFAAYQLVRKAIPHLSQDRQVHIDICAAEKIIVSGALLEAVENVLGPLP